MGLRKNLLALAGLIALLNLVAWGIPKIAPEVPERYEGVPIAAPYAPNVPITTPPPLPPGFPSMDRPPPEIEVPDGEPQPIATKFGLTYDIPADWRNASRGYGGWEDETGHSVVYGAIGQYGYESCSEQDGSTLAVTGATGSNDVDLTRVAVQHSRNADMIFGSSTGARTVTVRYSEPEFVEAAGSTAVRVNATVEDIPQDSPCDPPSATFDILTTKGYATAVTAVFMVQIDRAVDGALDHSVADQIFSSIRRS